MKKVRVILALPFIYLGLLTLLIGTQIRFGGRLTVLIFKGLALSVDSAANLEKENQKNG